MSTPVGLLPKRIHRCKHQDKENDKQVATLGHEPSPADAGGRAPAQGVEHQGRSSADARVDPEVLKAGEETEGIRVSACVSE